MAKEAIERMLTDKRNTYYIYWHSEEHIHAHEAQCERQKREEEESAEFMRSLDIAVASIPDKKQEAMKASDAFLEMLHIRAVRNSMLAQSTDTSTHAWVKPSTHKAEAMQSYTAKEEFDMMSLLPRDEQNRIVRYLCNQHRIVKHTRSGQTMQGCQPRRTLL